MLLQDLKRFMQPWEPIEQAGPYGEIEQRERLAALAMALLAEGVPGDLVEIGCLHGSTTVQLARVAQSYGRKVIAIDPWQPGTQNCTGAEYEIFRKTIAPYDAVIEVWRMRSDDPQATRMLVRRDLAFAFVDGLHTYEACLGDIEAVAHATVIAVDDTLWSTEVRAAFTQAAFRLNKETFQKATFRESYLLSKQTIKEMA